MKPKRPFMIAKGNDFAHVTYVGSIVTKESMRVKWVDWEGTKWATRDEAQVFLDSDMTAHLFEGAEVIEILEESRTRISAAR